MKKFDAQEYYIRHLKSDIGSMTQKDEKKKCESPKEEIQKELKKKFEKDEQKFYDLS